MGAWGSRGDGSLDMVGIKGMMWSRGGGSGLGIAKIWPVKI